MSSGNVILVTGFGPFGEHKINSSWEAVKLLTNQKIDDFDVVIEEIPVIYNYVDEKVPQLWKKYNPKLVVHVGVSGFTNKLTIETQAFRSGYVQLDCLAQKHPTGITCQDGDDCIKGTINAKEICDYINNNTNIKACISCNAGRYLCEFIYYKSLHVDKERTMFIHVPPLYKPYTAQQLADGLKEIIKCALKQLNA